MRVRKEDGLCTRIKNEGWKSKTGEKKGCQREERRVDVEDRSYAGGIVLLFSKSHISFFRIISYLQAAST